MQFENKNIVFYFEKKARPYSLYVC
jgi:hypothetical protein